VTIFNEDILKNNSNLINIKEKVVISCDVFKDKGGMRLTALNIYSLESLLLENKHNISLFAKNSDDINSILQVLNSSISDKSNSIITLYIKTEGNFMAKINLPEDFHLGENELVKLLEYS